jgi:hypothetical protein
MAIEHSLLERARAGFHDRVGPYRHSALLAAIIVAFAVRPLIGDTVFSIALVLLLLVALYNINVDELVGERGRLLIQARRRLRLGWVLAAAAAFERVSLIFVQGGMSKLVGSICWLLFFLFVTLSQLRSVLKQREVTGETISMAVLIYLLLGLTWVFCTPSSFNCIRTPLEALHSQNQTIRSRLGIYFRFWATSA